MKDADSHFSGLSSRATVPITSFEPKRRLSSSRSTLLRPGAAHDYQQNTRSSVAHLHYGAGLRRQKHLLASHPSPRFSPPLKHSCFFHPQQNAGTVWFLEARRTSGPGLSLSPVCASPFRPKAGLLSHFLGRYRSGPVRTFSLDSTRLE